MIGRLLERARRRMRRLGRTDETEPRASAAEETLKALLDEVVDRSVEASHPRTTPWARRPRVDREQYLQAILLVLEEARDAGRGEAEEALLDRVGWECACRCRAHSKIGCPRCLWVYGCPNHSEVTADQLRPELLRDAELLARALHDARAEVAGERGVELRGWEELGRPVRDTLVEAARRVVCVRVAGRNACEESSGSTPA